MDDIVKTKQNESRNPFEVLGIAQSLIRRLSDRALFHIVKILGKNLSMIYHPDSQFPDKNENRFAVVQEALEILKNEQLFELYKEAALNEKVKDPLKDENLKLKMRVGQLEKEIGELRNKIERLKTLIRLHWIDRFNYASESIQVPENSFFLTDLIESRITVGLIPSAGFYQSKIEKERDFLVLNDLQIADVNGSPKGLTLLGGISTTYGIGGRREIIRKTNEIELLCTPFVVPRRSNPKKGGSVLATLKNKQIGILGVLLDVKFPKGKPAKREIKEAFLIKKLKTRTIVT